MPAKTLTNNCMNGHVYKLISDRVSNLIIQNATRSHDQTLLGNVGLGGSQERK